MARVAELHDTLCELADLLEDQSGPIPAQVRRSAEEVARGDAHGARRFLGLGKGVVDATYGWERAEALRDRAAALAAELIRATDDSRRGR